MYPRTSFTFSRAIYDAVNKLPADIQAEIYPAIFAYALDGSLPVSLSPVAECVFALIISLIDNDNKKADAKSKGGAPIGNKNAAKKVEKSSEKTHEKKQPKNNLPKNKTTKNNLKTTSSTPLYNNYNILSNANALSNNYNLDDIEFKKFNIINNAGDVVADDDVVLNFWKKVTTSSFMEKAQKALSITQEDYIGFARTVVAEWSISSPENFLPEKTPEKHLLNQIRIKRDSPTEKKACQSRARVALNTQRASENKATQQATQIPAEPTGHEAFKIYLRSKGLDETTSLLDVVTTSSGENDAIREARRLLNS